MRKNRPEHLYEQILITVSECNMLTAIAKSTAQNCEKDRRYIIKKGARVTNFHESDFTRLAESGMMVCFHETLFCSVFNLLHVQYLLKSL